MFSSFDGTTLINNCSCFKCCIYSDSIEPVAPWFIGVELPLIDLKKNFGIYLMFLTYAPSLLCETECGGTKPPCDGCVNVPPSTPVVCEFPGTI